MCKYEIKQDKKKSWAKSGQKWKRKEESRISQKNNKSSRQNSKIMKTKQTTKTVFLNYIQENKQVSKWL